MASRNADSMTNAQGEFNPHKPRTAPKAPGDTSGHQIGRQVGNDAVPEFHAKTLPPGTAPKSATYQPNPVDETPGQALNPDAERSFGKERTTTRALDFPGATSADVHQGLGHPGQGQSAAEARHEGKSHRDRDTAGTEIRGSLGGLGAAGEELSAEAKRLLRDDNEHGPTSAREHNTSLPGANDKY